MYACIFIPDFSVQAIIRFEPELRTRPVAVLTGRPPLEKVVALNESARQSGERTRVASRISAPPFTAAASMRSIERGTSSQPSPA